MQNHQESKKMPFMSANNSLCSADGLYFRPQEWGGIKLEHHSYFGEGESSLLSHSRASYKKEKKKKERRKERKKGRKKKWKSLFY